MTQHAVTLAAAALLAGVASLPAHAQTAAAGPDKTSIWSIQGENASISSGKVTDRYYTNGIKLGWTSGEGMVPGAIENIGRLLWGKGEQRIAVDVTQQMYTPFNTAARVPPAGDRPYAGTLIAHFSLQQDVANTRSVLGMGVGVMGPGAGGEWVQNGFHDLIGQKKNNGWGSQLKNEPVLQFTSERTWRLPIATFGGIETDALPDLTAELGSLRIFAQTGVRFRVGQGLDSDYGPARLRPGQTGGDTFVPTKPLGWYVFAGFDGRAVLRDGTLEGNIFQKSASVKKSSYVGELEAGAAVLWHGVRLTYTHVLQSAEFKHQKGGLHQFGSLALSARF